MSCPNLPTAMAERTRSFPHTVESLTVRFAAACSLKQPINPSAIVSSLQRWIVDIGGPPDVKIKFISSTAEIVQLADAIATETPQFARVAPEARIISAASAVRAVSAVSAARAVSAVSAARAVSAVSAVRAVSAARAIWAAWAAWTSRTAEDPIPWDSRFDMTWLAITVIGAVSFNDTATAKTWLSILEAFEAGAFSFWIAADTIFVTTIPSVVKVDANRRLHCETGPAFVWLTGIEDYYWHGVHVPGEWITDRSLTPKTALFEPNIERRRAAIEILGGWGAVLDLLPNTILDTDSDPMIGTLISVQLPDLPRPEKFLRVTCGTGREFAFCVPEHVSTAMEAQAAIRGKTLYDFIPPEIRT